MPRFPINPPEENKLRKLERQLKNILVNSLSYTEVYNYSFVSPQSITKLGDDPSKYLELDNPLSKEKPFLRRYLLTNLLENAERNLANEDELRLFEVGKVFLAEKPGPRVRNNRAELLPRQDTWLAALYTAKKDNEPFWGARRVVEVIFEAWQKKWEMATAKDAREWEHPVRLGKIKVGSEEMGQVFELNPAVAEKFGINTKVGIMEINLTKLAELKKEKQTFYEPVPAYPDVARDLALVVTKKITHQEVAAELLGSDPLLKTVELFDLYAGAHINENKKSLAYHFIFRHPERTLKTEEVDAAMGKIKKLLKQKFAAEIRS